MEGTAHPLYKAQCHTKLSSLHDLQKLLRLIYSDKFMTYQELEMNCWVRKQESETPVAVESGCGGATGK